MNTAQSDKETKRVVTLDELVARATELKEHINILETTINVHLNQYREVQLAFDTLKGLPEASVQGYMILDRLSSVMLPVSVLEGWPSNVLVNLGLGYYLKTNRDKAVEILTRRLRELEKAINTLQSQRRVAVEEYLGLQRLISQIIESQKESK
ncbi:MAG: prefoldin domain-containing protein [Desulfurococcaceae archaeon]